MVAPKIDADDQRRIESMISQWRGKLTWEAIVDKVRLELGITTTRQTLCTYLGIQRSYKLRKRQLRGIPATQSDEVRVSDSKLSEQLENLRAEVIVLKKNNAEQLRMIERMLANANSIPNLDLRALVKPRPEELTTRSSIHTPGPRKSSRNRVTPNGQ